MENELYKKLSQKQGLLIQKASLAKESGDTKAKLEAEARIKYLIYLRERTESREELSSARTLFISYSKASGERHFLVAKRIAESMGFDVLTGFQSPDEELVLKAVLKTIKHTAVVLCIMTPEYKLQDRGAGPSVWLVEEKGMALALNKPFRMLVHESVHPDYWRRTTPDLLHSRFGEVDFEERATEAIRALYKRYDELIIKQLSEVGQ